MQETHIKNKLLDSYEANIALLAVEISIARRKLIELLQQIIEVSNQDGFSVKSNVYLKCDVYDLLKSYGEGQTQELVTEKLYNNRISDKISHRCNFGIHKADLCVEHKNKNIPANLCSTGEQKALLFNLIFSQASLCQQVTNQSPILLLDEIGAHFDSEKRYNMLNKLYNYPSQVIMTGVAKELFTAIDSKAQFINLSV